MRQERMDTLEPQRGGTGAVRVCVRETCRDTCERARGVGVCPHEWYTKTHKKRPQPNPGP